MTISFDDFMKVDVRVGTIVEVKEFPEAKKPAFKLKVDFGDDICVKLSFAQVTELYQTDQLVGKQVLAVVNFPKKQIGPFMSEVLGFSNEEDFISLVGPSHAVPNGARLH